jgi:hypothetical protein
MNADIVEAGSEKTMLPKGIPTILPCEIRVID